MLLAFTMCMGLMQNAAFASTGENSVAEEVVEAENIEVSDARFDEEVQKMAEMYRMDADKMKETMGDREKARIKEDIAVQEAITFLVDNAVEK